MSDNKHISIPKKVDTKDDLDFDFLRKEGIKYIEQFGSKLWTDYNSHDPGITILEVLSYAITDLGMRMDLDMEDILESDDSQKTLHTQFVKAIDILPSAPLSHLDYRKLFIDIGKGIGLDRPIKNCWLLPYQETIYTDCRTGNISFSIDDLGDKTSSFNIKGLYKLYIDTSEKGLSENDINDIKLEIQSRYQANRNLCEDLVAIEEIENQEIAICTRIEVEGNADEEFVHAMVRHKINQYLAPEVYFYSLNQLLDKGYTTDEIFEGPILDNGFIDTEELKNSQLRTEVRLSDIVQEIMKIDGVKQIKEISMSRCGADVSDPESNLWVLCLDSGKKPLLCEASSFSYSKGSLPLNINSEKVEQYTQQINQEEAIERKIANQNNTLDYPKGNIYEIDAHESILNEFPDTYGIGTYGIISKATPEREVLAKQLKGYLLFFDKILASYFKHLSKVKELLSVNGTMQQTYFTQALKGISGLEELVGSDYSVDNDELLTKTLFERIDNNVERRNKILDHLLGRFAERFSEYTFIMKTLYGNSVNDIVLSNKEAFLADYKQISRDRGLGYNYLNQPNEKLWNTDNVSGTQKRIARLLGIKNYTRRNVSESPVVIDKVETAEGDRYTWKINNSEGETILTSQLNYQIEYVATSSMYKAIFSALQIDEEEIENTFQKPISDGQILGGFKITLLAGNSYKYSIIDTPQDQNVIAYRATEFDSQEDLKQGIIEFLEYLKNEFTEEGIFLVENILLKPAINGLELEPTGIGVMEIGNTFLVTSDQEEEGISDYAFIEGCAEGCDSELIDPYSYRVSIVLPGYSYRFSDPDFRKYAEALIRSELPAHVLAKICWVGDRKSELNTAKGNLEVFEQSYEAFLYEKSKGGVSKGLVDSTRALIGSMNELYNIYRPGRLLDCKDESDDLGGRIILGQSNI